MLTGMKLFTVRKEYGNMGHVFEPNSVFCLIVSCAALDEGCAMFRL